MIRGYIQSIALSPSETLEEGHDYGFPHLHQQPPAPLSFLPRLLNLLIHHIPLTLPPTLLLIHPKQHHRRHPDQRRHDPKGAPVVPAPIHHRARRQRPDPRPALGHDAQQREEAVLAAARNQLRHERLAVRPLVAERDAVQRVEGPDLPRVVEADARRPHAGDAPGREAEAGGVGGVQERLGAEAEARLEERRREGAGARGRALGDEHERVELGGEGDAAGLRDGDDGLERGDAVGEDEVEGEVEEGLGELRAGAQGQPDLPQAVGDDVAAGGDGRAGAGLLEDEPGEGEEEGGAGHDGDADGVAEVVEGDGGRGVEAFEDAERERGAAAEADVVPAPAAVDDLGADELDARLVLLWGNGAVLFLCQDMQGFGLVCGELGEQGVEEDVGDPEGDVCWMLAVLSVHQGAFLLLMMYSAMAVPHCPALWTPR